MDELLTVPYWYPPQRQGGWEERGWTFSLGRPRLPVRLVGRPEEGKREGSL